MKKIEKKTIRAIIQGNKKNSNARTNSLINLLISNNKPAI